MSGTSAVEHVRLVDDQDREIPNALLEVDVDLWNDSYTRRTVFFDPGRVKRGILPNRELGRALVEGRTYAIVVATSWKDGRGQPLAREFRHTFTAGPPIERPLDPSAWTMGVPAKASGDPLVIRFPWALDAGLLHRAVGVTTTGGQPLDGQITLGADQRSWTFTPAQPWPDAPLVVAILTLLEDPSGNKVGQAFEFEMSDAPTAPGQDRVTIPFRPK
jgi:hypothetical protein